MVAKKKPLEGVLRQVVRKGVEAATTVQSGPKKRKKKRKK
jgi:hypothetical protein